jgi:hypothetical protein
MPVCQIWFELPLAYSLHRRVSEDGGAAKEAGAVDYVAARRYHQTDLDRSYDSRSQL